MVIKICIFVDRSIFVHGKTTIILHELIFEVEKFYP